MAQTGGTVSERVVREVASARGTDALDLPPLYDVIDPDALDAVVEEMGDGGVSFAYAGYEVRVARDGTVDLDARSTD